MGDDQEVETGGGGGDDKGSVASEASSRPRTPVPESDESDTSTDHEDFVEVHASHDSSPLDRELRGSPVRSVIADEPAPPVAAPRPPPSLSDGSQAQLEDLDDIRGDVSAWRKLCLADKFRFRIPLRFHEIMETIKRALKFPGEPQASALPLQPDAQACSLFEGVPPVAQTLQVTMPWDAMCATTAKRDTKGLLDGSSKTLGEAVFARKFPAAESNEKSFLTPQTIDLEAEKHFRVWVKKDFSAKKPFGTDTSSVLAAAEKLSVRLDKRLASVNRLSGLLIQVQAYIHHAAASQAATLQRLRADAAAPAPASDTDFDPTVVADAMEFAAYLTACISRISLHIQAEVRLDRWARLVNHLRPDGGLPGIPSFTKRKLLVLPLDSEYLFAGQFDQVLKDTTSTQAIALQASQIAAVWSGAGQEMLSQELFSCSAAAAPAAAAAGSTTSGPREASAATLGVCFFRVAGAGPGPNEVEPGPVGGRLREFAGAWKDITSDKWVLQTVFSGYRIEFTESCRLTRAPLWTIIPSKHKHRVALKEGLHKMLLKKAIVGIDHWW